MSNELINTSRPSFLTETNEDHLGAMRQFLRPSFIKIVQSQTGEPFKPKFRDGDVIVSSAGSLIKIADGETPMEFTPVFFSVSFICLNPIQTKAMLPALREWTTDENSELAKKCRAFVKEKCPEKPEFFLKYNQVLNFLVIVHGFEELNSIPLVLSFRGGEFKSGQTLIDLISARRAPPYASRFRATTSMHKNNQGFAWYGPDFQNASDPWVDETSFTKYKKLNADLSEIAAARRLDTTEQFKTGDDSDASNETAF